MKMIQNLLTKSKKRLLEKANGRLNETYQILTMKPNSASKQNLLKIKRKFEMKFNF